ncbi:hypothetical protein F4802DRAFT_302017 [Xylaria palmicola]|nr:hypothetical protein F4802DRAFT_302017 [Xylaria palmicola]
MPLYNSITRHAGGLGFRWRRSWLCLSPSLFLFSLFASALSAGACLPACWALLRSFYFRMVRLFPLAGQFGGRPELCLPADDRLIAHIPSSPSRVSVASPVRPFGPTARARAHALSVSPCHGRQLGLSCPPCSLVLVLARARMLFPSFRQHPTAVRPWLADTGSRGRLPTHAMPVRYGSGLDAYKITLLHPFFSFLSLSL